VAINPIWGFSWYFNTENWASAFWERVTEARTDVWREAMIAAVERAVLPTGVPKEALFEVRPDGVSDATDVHGPLRWRDLEIGGAVRPKGASPDDPAEWIVPMEK